MRVPTAADALPAVGPAPYKPVFQDPNAADGAFGQAGALGLQKAGAQLGDLGDKLGAEAMKMQNEDNARQAKLLDNQFAQGVQKIVYGDGTNANTGFYGKQGEDAITGAPDAKAQIDKLRQTMLDGITDNQRVKALFEGAAASRTTSEFGSIDRHTLDQRNKANDLASAARKNQAVNDAGLAWNDPDKLAQSLKIVAGEVADEAKRHGWSEDVATAQLREGQAAVYANVIHNAAQVDAATAQALLTKYSDQIDSTTYAKLERNVKTALTNERVQADHQDALRRRQETDAANKQESSYIGQLLNGQPVDLKAVANDPAFEKFGDKKLVIARAVAADAKGEALAKVSAQNAPSLLERMYLDPSDPKAITDRSQIYDEFIHQHINKTDTDWLVKQFDNLGDGEGGRLGQQQKALFDGVKGQIMGRNTLGMLDDRGGVNYYAYQQYVIGKVAEYRKGGKDPFTLFQPNSPDFIGSANVVNQFKYDAKQTLDYNMSKIKALSGKTAAPASPLAPPKPTITIPPGTKSFTNDKGEKAYLIGGKYVNQYGEEVK